MAWVEVTTPERAKGELKDAYARIEKARGKVANVLQISGALPSVMERGVDFYMALMYGDHPLSRARREMVAVAVSRANACEYCIQHHRAALARVWNDDAAASRFAKDGTLVAPNAADEAMLEYAWRLTLTPSGVTRNDVEALRKAGFSDAEIVAINHVVGYFNMMNRIVNGLGVHLEADQGADARYKY